MTPTTPTSLAVSATVNGASALGPLAAAELEARVQSYADEVFAEASRYESLQRADATRPAEFTSRHIVDADDAVRRRFTVMAAAPSPRGRIIGSVGLYLFAAGVGVGGNQLDETWGVAVFVACLVAGLFTVALLEIGRGSR